MNHRRVRGPRFHLEYEYSSETKDQMEDLLTKYPDSDEVITRAIEAFHEFHFGSSTKRTPPQAYSQTFTGESEAADKKLDELWTFIQDMKAQVAEQVSQEVVANTTVKQPTAFTEEANEKILEKIDELGMKFQKIASDSAKPTTQKQITTEMSNEEVLQLIKRIDKLESKLTKAISQSRVAIPASSGSSRRPLKDFGEPPKIGEVKAVEGQPIVQEDRPLLEDVLDTVIVSIDEE